MHHSGVALLYSSGLSSGKPSCYRNIACDMAGVSILTNELRTLSAQWQHDTAVHPCKGDGEFTSAHALVPCDVDGLQIHHLMDQSVPDFHSCAACNSSQTMQLRAHGQRAVAACAVHDTHTNALPSQLQ